MNIATAPKIWGTTIFADDVRQEVQGTLTIVGMYATIMYLHQPLPAVLPKFALVVKIFAEPGYLNGDAILRVFIPGMEAPVLENIVPFGNVGSNDGNLFDDKMNSPDVSKNLQTQIPLMFSPLQINEEGAIRVRLYVGETEYRIGALIIRKALTSPASTASPPPPSRSPPAAPAS